MSDVPKKPTNFVQGHRVKGDTQGLFSFREQRWPMERQTAFLSLKLCFRQAKQKGEARGPFSSSSSLTFLHLQAKLPSFEVLSLSGFNLIEGGLWK